MGLMIIVFRKDVWKSILTNVAKIEDSTDFFKSGAASMDVVRYCKHFSTEPSTSTHLAPSLSTLPTTIQSYLLFTPTLLSLLQVSSITMWLYM